MTGIDFPTLSVVVTSAAIDSINPCAIGVLILMISVVLSGKGTLGRMLLLGSLYIFAVFLTYLLAGLGLVYFLASIPLVVTEYLSLTVGSLVIFAGLLEIKDYFWYGKGFSLQIPPLLRQKNSWICFSHNNPGRSFLGRIRLGCRTPLHGCPILSHYYHPLSQF